MITDAPTDTKIDMSASIERRLAALRADAARPVVMPDRPTDRSRNGMRGSRPSPRRRAIR